MGRCENIIGGSVRASDSYRDIHGWQIPNTDERELAFALKHARAASPRLFGETLRLLARIGRERTWLGDDDLRVIAQRTGSPISYQRGSIRRLNDWLARLPETLSAGEWSPTICRLRDAHWTRGIPVSMLLAGDEVALGPWALAHAAIAGAPIVAKPSNAEPLSTYRFCRALLESGLTSLSLLHLDRDRDAHMIRRMLAALPQSVVFGEDATIDAVYGPAPPPPPHKAIPYWAGRSGALVLPDADLELAAQAIVEGVAEDRGNRCISTKKAFVPRRHMPRMLTLLARAADALRRGPPDHDDTDLGRQPESARAMAEAAAAEGTILYERDLLIVQCSPGARLLRQELPYPILALCPYDEGSDPVELANACMMHTPTRRALAMSVFSTSETAFRAAAGSLAACKVLWNQPTTRMDFATRHQGWILYCELMRETEIVA